jgi:PAS domain S-box-containing protein
MDRNSMKDDDKSKSQLIEELQNARDQIETLNSQTNSHSPTQQRYRQLFNNMREGVAIYEAVDDGENFIFVDYNKAGQILDNTLAKNIIGKKVTEVFPGIVEFGLFDIFKQVYKTGTSQSHPISLYDDGNLAFYRENYVYKLSGGQIVTIYNDETIRVQSEQAAQKSEVFLNAMFESVQEGITVLDTNFTVLRTNPMLKLWYPETQLLGQKCYSCFHGKSAPCEPCPSARALESGNSEFAIMPGPENSPVEWLEIYSYPIRNHQTGNITGVVEFMRDITQKKKSEVEKVKLEEQYQQSQKMEAVGRLAGGIAHDFNNILCAITGNATLSIEDLPPDHPQHEYMEDIIIAADRATDLTRQLLAFSRKQLIEPKVINLSQVIKHLHSMLYRLIGEDIILRTIPQNQLGRVMVDPGQVEQIVLNLAVNARDAMPKGGELLIETANITLDDEYCKTHTNSEPGNYVMLSVSDTGCGMNAQVKKLIFEPFFTTKELGHGTGLGLATVFGIVKQNGGRIDVHSEPDMGTSFKVYFPRITDKAETFVPSTTTTELKKGNETILLVEDEDIVRKLAKNLLNHLGYNVLSANSGKNALKMEEEHSGSIDLLLTDVVMPNMNGRQLATLMTEKRPQIKVLFASGYTQDVIAHHGVLDEGIQFVAKPYALTTLSSRIREILDKV